MTDYRPVKHINALPDQALRAIFCRLSVEDVLQMDQVCLYWASFKNGILAELTHIKQVNALPSPLFRRLTVDDVLKIYRVYGQRALNKITTLIQINRLYLKIGSFEFDIPFGYSSSPPFKHSDVLLNPNGSLMFPQPNNGSYFSLEYPEAKTLALTDDILLLLEQNRITILKIELNLDHILPDFLESFENLLLLLMALNQQLESLELNIIPSNDFMALDQSVIPFVDLFELLAWHMPNLRRLILQAPYLKMLLSDRALFDFNALCLRLGEFYFYSLDSYQQSPYNFAMSKFVYIFEKLKMDTQILKQRSRKIGFHFPCLTTHFERILTLPYVFSIVKLYFQLEEMVNLEMLQQLSSLSSLSVRITKSGWQRVKNIDNLFSAFDAIEHLTHLALEIDDGTFKPGRLFSDYLMSTVLAHLLEFDIKFHMNADEAMNHEDWLDDGHDGYIWASTLPKVQVIDVTIVNPYGWNYWNGAMSPLLRPFVLCVSLRHLYAHVVKGYDAVHLISDGMNDELKRNFQHNNHKHRFTSLPDGAIQAIFNRLPRADVLIMNQVCPWLASHQAGILSKYRSLSVTIGDLDDSLKHEMADYAFGYPTIPDFKYPDKMSHPDGSPVLPHSLDEENFTLVYPLSTALEDISNNLITLPNISTIKIFLELEPENLVTSIEHLVELLRHWAPQLVTVNITIYMWIYANLTPSYHQAILKLWNMFTLDMPALKRLALDMPDLPLLCDKIGRNNFAILCARLAEFYFYSDDGDARCPLDSLKEWRWSVQQRRIGLHFCFPIEDIDKLLVLPWVSSLVKLNIEVFSIVDSRRQLSLLGQFTNLMHLTVEMEEMNPAWRQFQLSLVSLFHSISTLEHLTRLELTLPYLDKIHRNFTLWKGRKLAKVLELDIMITIKAGDIEDLGNIRQYGYLNQWASFFAWSLPNVQVIDVKIANYISDDADRARLQGPLDAKSARKAFLLPLAECPSLKHLHSTLSNLTKAYKVIPPRVRDYWPVATCGRVLLP